MKYKYIYNFGIKMWFIIIILFLMALAWFTIKAIKVGLYILVLLFLIIACAAFFGWFTIFMH